MSCEPSGLSDVTATLLGVQKKEEPNTRFETTVHNVEKSCHNLPVPLIHTRSWFLSGCLQAVPHFCLGTPGFRSFHRLASLST